MQPYRIAFHIFVVASIVVVAWSMMRSQGAKPEKPAAVAKRNTTTKGQVGFAAAAMTLEVPGDPSNENTVWFRDLALASGVDFKHFSGALPELPLPALYGSGVGVFDFDKDGRYDLYFGTGTPFPLLASRHLPINRCYRNEGKWHFVDVTPFAKVGHNGYTTGLAIADYDNDGFSDLYVCCLGQDGLYHNQGDGTFLRAECGAAMLEEQWSTSATWADVDQDGLLDLYVCNFVKWDWDEHQSRRQPPLDREGFDSPLDWEPETDRIYRNLGDGTFENWSARAGLEQSPGRSLSVMACDFNHDDLTDFIVTQDPASIVLRVNQGNGRFESRPLTGVKSTSESEASGTWHSIAGFNGRFLFTGRRGEGANLIRFDGAGNATLDSTGDQIRSSTAGWNGWGAALGDLNLDGIDDLMITNGLSDRRSANSNDLESIGQVPQLFELSKGHFIPVGPRAGNFFTTAKNGRGLATVDLDNDRDLDVVITHLDGYPAVLKNSAITARNGHGRGIQLELVGTTGSRDAVGAAIFAQSPAGDLNIRIDGGGNYLSANDRRIMIAGSADGPLGIEVRWPNGRRTAIHDLHPGHSYVIIESDRQNVAPTVAVRPTSD